MKKLTQLLSLLFTLTILLSACGDDDDDNNDDNNDVDPMETIDISDPDEVTKEIFVVGSSEIDGDPPAPSTDPQAPTLDSDEFEDELVSTQGGTVLIDVDVNSGDIAGTYIQIPGADAYFDIPFNPNGRVLKRGRFLQRDEDPVIEIEIPDNLGVGTFCAEVCVYDSEARVSNIVEVCVDITELGGENSSFLTENKWSAIRFEETEDGFTEEFELGELTEYTFLQSLECGDGTFKDVEITESDRTDRLDMTFSSNGSITVVIEEFERDVDFVVSTCEQQTYIEEESTTTLNGTWSYNDNSKELILVLEVTSSTITEDIGDIEIIEFAVDFDDASNTLTLTQSSDGEVEKIVLLAS